MVRPGLERLEINFYTVSIGVLTGGVAPADGHIDHTTPEEYGVTGFPTTKLLSLAKERANMRWEAILRQISLEIQPLQVSSVVATGATKDAPATAFEFTVAYDKVEYLRTEDETSPGTFLTEDAAIKRWVERALTTDHTSNRFIYNPDNVPATSIIQGPMIESVTATKVEAAVPIATVVVAAVAKVTDTI